VEDKERQGAGIHNDDDAETNDRVYDIDSDSARPAEGAGDGADEPPAGNEHRPRFSRKQILDRFAEKNSAIGKLQKEKNTLEKEREAWAAEKSALEAQVKENKDKWLRSAADFENYRKRTTKEWELLKQQSRTEVILEVLNSLDDFERAFAAVEPGRDDDFVKGVRLIYSKLLQVLQKMGVAEVDSLHQPFDPTRHMAIGQIETDETASGNVARVITKGYIFNGSVIRPAHVIVAK
jgi:molecular chaperone GrpE